MKKELEEKIFEKYPLLYADKDAPPNKSLMCYGFSCGDGWYRIIDKLSSKIEEHIKENWAPNNYPKAVQVKEKFGGLRFYMSHSDDTIRKYIREAEEEADKTCDLCGREGKPQSVIRYSRVICDQCLKTLLKKE